MARRGADFFTLQEIGLADDANEMLIRVEHGRDKETTRADAADRVARL
jgi:hypothetical protein